MEVGTQARLDQMVVQVVEDQEVLVQVQEGVVFQINLVFHQV